MTKARSRQGEMIAVPRDVAEAIIAYLWEDEFQGYLSESDAEPEPGGIFDNLAVLQSALDGTNWTAQDYAADFEATQALL